MLNYIKSCVAGLFIALYLIGFSSIDTFAQVKTPSVRKHEVPDITPKNDAKTGSSTSTSTTNNRKSTQKNTDTSTNTNNNNNKSRGDTNNSDTTTNNDSRNGNDPRHIPNNNNRNNNRNNGFGIFTNPTCTNCGNKGVFFDGNINTVTDGRSIALDAFPFIGYRFPPRFVVGAGPIYQMYQGNGVFSNNFGGRGFARLNVLTGVFASAELEIMSFQWGSEIGQRQVVSRFPIGGGIQGRFLNMNMNFAVMYDLLYNVTNSPYNSPLIIRGGINLGR